MKLIIWIGITVGGLVGAYLPVLLFHADPLGIASILSGTIGSFVGLWAGFKANDSLDV